MAVKKTKILKALRVFGWVVAVSGVFVLLGFVDTNLGEMPCNEFHVALDHNDMRFIEEDDIRERITDLGNPIIGEPMSSLDIQKYEEEILNMPEVEAAEVYKTIDGRLVAEVTQRRPIVRIINMNDSLSVYIDDKGHVMPWSNKYTARVLVVNGYLNVPRSGSVDDVLMYDTVAAVSMLDDVFELAQFIERDPFWSAQIQQAYVTPEGEFEMIPRVGGHTIIFGDLENKEGKFSKLRAFYRKGLKNTDWNIYKSINLKYKDQIVCTKKQ